MSEPLKPRIDFDGPLQAEKIPPLKSARAFDTLEADNFAPARLVTGEEEEGAAEAVVESVLRPKRSLWRRMVSAGLAIFGVSVVAQGVQWTANAWQTQDWIALGGCVAGALIVGAGVGSVATEWRRLWRLRQRAHERDEARDMLHSHAVGKAKAFCEKLAQQAGLDQSHPALQRWYAGARCPGAAGNQPFGGGVDADDCRQSAGAGGYGVYRLAEPAADQPNRHVVRH